MVFRRHVRPNFTNVAFQVNVNFGVPAWPGVIEGGMRKTERIATAPVFNRRSVTSQGRSGLTLLRPAEQGAAADPEDGTQPRQPQFQPRPGIATA